MPSTSDIATMHPSACPSTPPKKSSPKSSCSSTPSSATTASRHNNNTTSSDTIVNNVTTPNSSVHLSNQYGFPLNYNGQIQLIFGNMFAGKTSELLRRLRRYQFAQKETVLVKYINDDRYSKENVSTHDQVQQKAIPTDRLEKIAHLLLDYHVIGIDEGQFFPDLVEFCEAAANGGKIVIVSALDGTFQRKPFGNVLSLVPMAESVVKLKAVCMVCGRDAAFSKRITDEQQTEVIGGSDKYIATCRKCYMTRNTPYSKKNKSVFQESMLDEHEDCSDYTEHCELFTPQKH